MTIKISQSLRVPVEFAGGKTADKFIALFNRVEDLPDVIDGIKEPATAHNAVQGEKFIEVKERLIAEGLEGESLEHAISLEIFADKDLKQKKKTADKDFANNLIEFLEENFIDVDKSAKFVDDDGKPIDFDTLKPILINNVEYREPLFAALDAYINDARNHRKS